MIGMISGACLMVGTGEAIVDCAGVGYLLQCGSRTLGALTEGQPARLHVETHVRETAITLYGFHTEEERAWFVRLQSVQGVGPKAALAILDILTPGEILSAASLEDKTAFGRAKGVGPKSASRIAIELSGKPAPLGRGFQPVFTPPSADTPNAQARNEGLSDMKLRNDAVSALVNLGIGQSDALRAVAKAYITFPDDPQIDELVKAAFKELGS
ncbi:MAG: Holliday junction branch migration protein RuvA [Litorimonas sp.]